MRNLEQRDSYREDHESDAAARNNPISGIAFEYTPK